MKKNILLLLLSATTAYAKGQLIPVLWQVKTDTIIRWEYFFGDEFSSSEVNEDKWFKGYPWGGLDISADTWTDPANLKITDGVLALEMKREKTPRKFPDWMIDTVAIGKKGKKLIDGKYPLQYSGSSIMSKQKFKYGYYECRFKMPAGKGLWPAFWLYGGNPNDEIDFMELKGEKEKDVHIDVHCPEGCDKGYKTSWGLKKDWGGWIRTSQNIYKDWNIISGVWMPGYVTMYLNGDLLGYFRGDFKNSMNLIANITVSCPDCPFNPGPDDKNVFPTQMDVDYIRVWKPVGDSTFAARKIRIFEPDLAPKKDDEKIQKAFLGKKISFMLPKKIQKNETGFVSLYPAGEKIYRVWVNGKKLGAVHLSLYDESDKLVKEDDYTGSASNLDLTQFPAGLYKLKIKAGDKTSETKFNLR